MDAGIPLKSLAAAVTIGFLESDGCLIIDPCKSECERVSSWHCFSHSFAGSCIGNLSLGVYSIEDYMTSLDVAKSAMPALFQFMRQTMEGKVVGEVRLAL